MKILVVGAGQMGGGIAQIAALSGDAVTLLDRERSLVDSALTSIRKALARSVEKGRFDVHAAQLGMNHPIGPLELADYIGLDTVLAILDVLYDGFRDGKYRPSPLLREYVDAGWYGRKTGLGFCDWRSGDRQARTDLTPSGVPAFTGDGQQQDAISAGRSNGAR